MAATLEDQFSRLGRPPRVTGETVQVPTVVWLAEECRLLEQKNYELQQELKAAHAATEHARAQAEASKQDATHMREVMHDSSVKQSTAQRAEERQLELIAKLRARIAELETALKKVSKERRDDANMLNVIALKHANTQAAAEAEAKRHAFEEGKYTSLLTDFQAVTQREMETLRTELVASNRRRDELVAMVQSLERKAVDAREETTHAYAQLAESRDREQALVLERESISLQLSELAKAYRHDMSDAEAQAAGGAALREQLAETQGRLREAEADGRELRRMMSEMLAREGALVGKLTLERHTTQLATAAKVRADRLTQVQHMEALDARIKMDRQTDVMLARAARTAVAQAVGTLTARPGKRPAPPPQPPSLLAEAGGGAGEGPLAPRIPQGIAASAENLHSLAGRAKALVAPAFASPRGSRKSAAVGAAAGLLGRLKQHVGGAAAAAAAAAPQAASVSGSGSGSPNRFEQRQAKTIREDKEAISQFLMTAAFDSLQQGRDPVATPSSRLLAMSWEDHNKRAATAGGGPAPSGPTTTTTTTFGGRGGRDVFDGDASASVVAVAHGVAGTSAGRVFRKDEEAADSTEDDEVGGPGAGAARARAAQRRQRLQRRAQQGGSRSRSPGEHSSGASVGAASDLCTSVTSGTVAGAAGGPSRPEGEPEDLSAAAAAVVGRRPPSAVVFTPATSAAAAAAKLQAQREAAAAAQKRWEEEQQQQQLDSARRRALPPPGRQRSRSAASAATPTRSALRGGGGVGGTTPAARGTPLRASQLLPRSTPMRATAPSSKGRTPQQQHQQQSPLPSDGRSELLRTLAAAGYDADRYAVAAGGGGSDGAQHLQRSRAASSVASASPSRQPQQLRASFAEPPQQSAPALRDDTTRSLGVSRVPAAALQPVQAEEGGLRRRNSEPLAPEVAFARTTGSVAAGSPVGSPGRRVGNAVWDVRSGTEARPAWRGGGSS